MARLPTPGADAGNWGTVLNDFLSVEHNPDGTLNPSGSIALKYTKPAGGIPPSDFHADVQASLAKADVALNQAQVDSAISAATPPVDVQEFGAVGSGDETTKIRAALAYAKAQRRPLRFRAGVTYTVDSLDLSCEDDAPDATIYGYRAVPIIGGGPRATILKQAAGATAPLITVRGSAANSTTGHQGKVLGALIEGMELRGQGIGSGQGVGIRLAIYHLATIRDCYISEFGSDGIQLSRPVRTAGRDDYSHLFEIENCKVFRNGGAGIRTPDDHAVGPGLIANVESSYNGGHGFDLIPAGIELVGCLAFANGLGGLRTRESQNGSPSFAQGLVALGCRFEGNLATEVNLEGGAAPTLVGCTIFGTNAGGFTCLSIGDGASPVRQATVIGGYVAGNGGSSGTAGQRAIRLGANATTTTILNPRVDPAQFKDAYLQNDPMFAISNAGTGTTMQLAGGWRTAQTLALTSSSAVAMEARLFSQSKRRWALYASGRQEYGDGTNPVDAFTARRAAGVWGTEDTTSFQAGSGVWDQGHLVLGGYHLWIDGSGNLRIKNGTPTSALDGTVVGSQA